MFSAWEDEYAIQFPYALWRDLVSDFAAGYQLVLDDPSQFPYALWRDLVSDRDRWRDSRKGSCFHTPYGVTLFRTRSSHSYRRIDSFPYALWRDLVSDPALVYGARTCGDAAGLHRWPGEGPY